MSKNRIAKAVKRMRKAGLSFRQIEARMPKSLGAGNGTKAYRILKAAA